MHAIHTSGITLYDLILIIKKKGSPYFHILAMYRTLSYATLQCVGILYTAFYLLSCKASILESSSTCLPTLLMLFYGMT